MGSMPMADRRLALAEVLHTGVPITYEMRMLWDALSSLRLESWEEWMEMHRDLAWWKNSRGMSYETVDEYYLAVGMHNGGWVVTVSEPIIMGQISNLCHHKFYVAYDALKHETLHAICAFSSEPLV
jgi:hypothetical protein